MRYSKQLLIGILLVLLVTVAWVQEFIRAERVNVQELNVLINEIEQTLANEPGSINDLVEAFKQKTSLTIQVIEANHLIPVTVKTPRGTLKTDFDSSSLSNGLFTYRGVDFYIVPLNSAKRIAFYGQAPAIHQLHHNESSLSAVLLSILIVVVLGFGMWAQSQVDNFKLRLAYVMGPEAKDILQSANATQTSRYIINKLTELSQDLVEEKYSHQVENTKQDERLRNMMHDMKTPIAALHAFVEAFEDGLYQPEQLGSKMPLVVRNVNHLLHLTDQYDKYLRYANWTNRSNMRRYPLDYIVQEVLMGVERDFVALGRIVKLVLMESPGFVVCDITELKKLLHILVENAHKYSDKDRPIVLSAMVRSGMIYISVKDYGIGIALDQHNAIFEPFVKVDKARGASAKSYGIGLYIAKQIVIFHGGDILLESEFDKGATFTVILPIVESE